MLAADEFQSGSMASSTKFVEGSPLIEAEIDNDLSEKENEPTIKNFEYELDETTARYVRVIAQNRGVCPFWHPKAGEPAWLFEDEIVVE